MGFEDFARQPGYTQFKQTDEVSSYCHQCFTVATSDEARAQQTLPDILLQG